MITLSQGIFILNHLCHANGLFMNSVCTIEKYKKLIHSLRSYLLQEYSKDTWITTDKNTYDYFAKQAFKSAQNAKITAPKTTQTSWIAPPPPSRAPTMPTPKAIQTPAEKPLPAHEQPVAPIHFLPRKTESIAKQVADSTPRPQLHFEQKQFLPEPLQPIVPISFTEMLTFFKEKLPSIPLSDSIPNDSEAKAFASRWRAPAVQVLLLSFSNIPKEQQFLAKVAQAIDQRLASTKVVPAYKIEEENGWEELLNANTLRLVISSNNSLHTLPELMKFYREESTGKHTLGRVQLFLLADLSLYMEQPALKASLWKSLCHCLGSQ